MFFGILIGINIGMFLAITILSKFKMKEFLRLGMIIVHVLERGELDEDKEDKSRNL